MRTCIGRRSFEIAFFVICVALVILHPYTVCGKPGVLVAVFFGAYALGGGWSCAYFNNFIIPALLLLLIGIWGGFVSVFNGIMQFNHLLACISFLVMLLAASGVSQMGRRLNLSADDFLLILLSIIILNSVVVLIEVEFDPFRQLVEKCMVQFIGGAINYRVGYRLRGLASSGGAGLSISVSAATVIAIDLFRRNVIELPFFLVSLCVLLFSCVVIGRTGIILSVVPVACFAFSFLLRSHPLSSWVRLLVVVPITFFMLLIFIWFLKYYFSSRFDRAFVEYGFGFLMRGASGFESEGTLRAIVGFLGVLPYDFPQSLIGCGFYGGSEFAPWTDSGYSRTFLSVGFILGSLFYYLVYSIYFMAFDCNQFLFLNLISILAISEFKEPLLFSGVASRVFILILVFYYHGQRVDDVKSGLVCG